MKLSSQCRDMVESNNPFAGEFPPADSADLGEQNGTRTDPAIVGDNSSLKIAVEGESVPGMQPLNIDHGSRSGPEPSGKSNRAVPFTAAPHTCKISNLIF